MIATGAWSAQIGNWLSLRIPMLEHAALVQLWAGLRPLSPDAYPLLGRASGWENVILAQADFLGHFAEDDDFEPVEEVRRLEENIRSSGRQVSFFLYPGTRHWFFEENRPEYDAQAAHVAWERTIEFLHERLD